MRITDKISTLAEKIRKAAVYCISGVWDDHRQTMGVRIIRTLNLSVNSFLNRDLQNRAMSLTYSTVLALVPAIAMIVAIGRGFGLQDTLQDELYFFFPSQHKAITTALSFVDTYLSQASQGLFVGIGLIFLLWTVISLLSSIEDSFNMIWDVNRQRSFFQKITDYIAICLIVPILMICASGVSIFMSSIFQDNLNMPWLTPLVNVILEMAPLFLCWIAFTLSYVLIPNTKISIKYAALAGAICAIGFTILQLLFVNGQIYVSKYNAIYGSFAFLPLLLIWLQLSWLLLLSGCVLTYSLQNVFTFNFHGNSNQLSIDGWNFCALIMICVIARRFSERQTPITDTDIAREYNLPIRVVSHISQNLHKAGLLYSVRIKDNSFGEIPAIELDDFTVKDFFESFNSSGELDIVKDLKPLYKKLSSLWDANRLYVSENFGAMLVKDLPLPSAETIRQQLVRQSQ